MKKAYKQIVADRQTVACILLQTYRKLKANSCRQADSADKQLAADKQIVAGKYVVAGISVVADKQIVAYRH